MATTAQIRLSLSSKLDFVHLIGISIHPSIHPLLPLLIQLSGAAAGLPTRSSSSALQTTKVHSANCNYVQCMIWEFPVINKTKPNRPIPTLYLYPTPFHPNPNHGTSRVSSFGSTTTTESVWKDEQGAIYSFFSEFFIICPNIPPLLNPLLIVIPHTHSNYNLPSS